MKEVLGMELGMESRHAVSGRSQRARIGGWIWLTGLWLDAFRIRDLMGLGYQYPADLDILIMFNPNLYRPSQKHYHRGWLSKVASKSGHRTSSWPEE